MKGIKIYDQAGGIDKQSPLLFEIRAFMDSKRSIKEHVLGNDLVEKFCPPTVQDGIRVRSVPGLRHWSISGDMKVLIEKKPFTNPADSSLQNALKNERDFNKVQLDMEESETDKTDLVDARKVLIALIGKRNISGDSAGTLGCNESLCRSAGETRG